MEKPLAGIGGSLFCPPEEEGGVGVGRSTMWERHVFRGSQVEADFSRSCVMGCDHVVR